MPFSAVLLLPGMLEVLEGLTGDRLLSLWLTALSARFWHAWQAPRTAALALVAALWPLAPAADEANAPAGEHEVDVALKGSPPSSSCLLSRDHWYLRALGSEDDCWGA